MQSGSASDDDDELFLSHCKPALGPVSSHDVSSQHHDLRYFETENNGGCFFSSYMQSPACPDSKFSVEARTERHLTDSSIQPAEENQPPIGRVLRQGSIVDGLLHEIYDRWHYGRNDSIDSDTLTECSSTSDMFFHHRQEPGGYHSAVEKRHGGTLNKSFLQNQSLSQLQRMLSDLQRSIAVMNVRLVKQLKRRDRRQAKLQRNFDIVTAVLQASSLKRQIDTRMKFSIQPPPGGSAFEQWRDAMKAVCRLPLGLPPEFRKKVWLSLADHYLFQQKINWEKTVRFAFNERSNPDDEQLGMQIVKDLHRTGCSNFSGDDNDEDRAVLKRLLLAYARWNKRVGYCQGFNVIAALLLNVMDRKEGDALKVMIYLIDSVLPESYFANNLRALSVDMAVFRDLLKLTYPKLSKHLDRLQLAAQDVRTGACYEPPLTNVFTMQWFLTLFATCLPVCVVLRVWDSVLLEGSEVLLRTALTIWGKLAKRIMGASSADEFYSLMGELSSSVMQGFVFDGDTMVKSIYSLGDFPLPHLNELREKYTYNIRPISQPSGSSKKNGRRNVFKSLLNSDEDELDDDDIAAIACMPAHVGSSDISVLGPGVYGSGMEEGAPKGVPEMERMTTDIQSLKLQYERLKQRQKQAHVIIAAAASMKKAKPQVSHELGAQCVPPAALVPNIESPVAVNHLFLGKTSTGTRNRLVTDGPRISAPSHLSGNAGFLTKQLQAVASAQALTKSKRMKSSSKGVTVAAPSSQVTEASGTYFTDPVASAPTSSELNAFVDSCRHREDVAGRLAIMTGEISNTLKLVKDSPSDSVHSVESVVSLEQSSKELVTDHITGTVLPIDLSLTNTESCHTEHHVSVESSCETAHSLKECSVLDLYLKEPVACDKADSKSDKVSDSESKKICGSDISSHQDVQATPSSAENLASEKHCLGSSENVTSDVSPVTEKLLATCESVEDSGEVSFPATFKAVLEGKKCDLDRVSEKNTVVSWHETNTLLLQEKRAVLEDASKQISVKEIQYSCDPSCDPSDLDLTVMTSYHDDGEPETGREQKTDLVTECGPASDGCAVEDESLEGAAPLIEGASTSKVALPSNRLSATPDIIDEVSFMLTNVSTSSPKHEFFVHPSSVIETVPISATVGVGKLDAELSGAVTGNMHKTRRSSSSKGGNNVGKTDASELNLNGGGTSSQHSTVFSYKPSGHHKKARRFSSPAGADMTLVNCQNVGQPSVVKTTSRPFNPFPVRHFNANRAKTGLKLGLYSESTLEKLRGLKPRTSSS